MLAAAVFALGCLQGLAAASSRPPSATRPLLATSVLDGIGSSLAVSGKKVIVWSGSLWGLTVWSPTGRLLFGALKYRNVTDVQVYGSRAYARLWGDRGDQSAV